MTKITRHAIIQNGTRYKIYLSINRTDGTVSMTADGYRGFGGLRMTDILEGLGVTDNSDMMTDYFERPRIEVPVGHPLIEILEKIEEKARIQDAKRKEQKLQKREKLLAETQDKVKVEGIWYEVLTQQPHQHRDGWTAYTIKKIGNRAQKTYFYAHSADGYTYTRPYTIGKLS